jgi:hypothetical protein
LRAAECCNERLNIQTVEIVQVVRSIQDDGSE